MGWKQLLADISRVSGDQALLVHAHRTCHASVARGKELLGWTIRFCKRNRYVSRMLPTYRRHAYLFAPTASRGERDARNVQPVCHEPFIFASVPRSGWCLGLLYGYCGILRIFVRIAGE